ncbi:hypothetical protein [Saccharothrix sp. HUAS TT1]|uniref:hypothetical protein n=1 Tax=unclassified Saccharothrix TaxID=2593673 RepID=UPI00345B5A0D
MGATLAAGSAAWCGNRSVRHANSAQTGEYWSARPSTRLLDSRSGATWSHEPDQVAGPGQRR